MCAPLQQPEKRKGGAVSSLDQSTVRQRVGTVDFHIVDMEWDSAYLTQDILLSLLSNQVNSL